MTSGDSLTQLTLVEHRFEAGRQGEIRLLFAEIARITEESQRLFSLPELLLWCQTLLESAGEAVRQNALCFLRQVSTFGQNLRKDRQVVFRARQEALHDYHRGKMNQSTFNSFRKSIVYGVFKWDTQSRNFKACLKIKISIFLNLSL